MEITIGKTRRGARLSDALPGHVYVGRPSVLGNPFQVGRDGSREQVIQLYRAWLWRQLRQQGAAATASSSGGESGSQLLRDRLRL